jgi:hypothetical protein
MIGRLFSFIPYLLYYCTHYFDLVVVFLQALRSVIVPSVPELTAFVVGHVFTAVFLRISPPSFHMLLLEEYARSPFVDDSFSLLPEIPPPKIEPYDGLTVLELLFSATQDFSLRFSFPLDDENEWREREIALIALSICETQDGADTLPIRTILTYFCERRQIDRRTFEMFRIEEFFEGFLPAYRAEFSESLGSSLAVLKGHLDKMQRILKSQPTVAARGSVSLASAELINHLRRLQSAAWTGDSFERDPTLCVFFCPFKMRRAIPRQTPNKPILVSDVVFEKTALQITLKNEPLSITFKLAKDHFVIETPTQTSVFSNSLITHIHGRRKTGIEIYLKTGTSYLIDFQTLDAFSFAKIARKADLPACRVLPRPDLFATSKLQSRWLAGDISSFEYLAKLNVLDGRSFHDASSYPIFPAILADFADLRSAALTAPGAPFDSALSIRDAFARGVVPADCFFRPDSVAQLPPWAASPAEFVDKMRRLLEAPGTSAKLHRWISAAFPVLLGHRTHPARKPPSRAAVVGQSEAVALAGCTIRTAAEIRPGSVVIALSDGSVGTLSYEVGDLRPSFVAQPGQIPESAVISGGARKLVGFVREKCQLTVVGVQKPIATFNVYADCAEIAPIGEDVYFCPDGASVAKISLRSGTVRPLCPAFGRVARIAADTGFRIIAIATMDGIVHVCELLTGELVNSANVEGEAKLLVITPRWGYVIALVGGWVVVLNVDGVVLRMVEAAWPMSAWFPFVSPSDFDYVAFVTEDRKIGMFEPLQPASGWPFHEAQEPLVAVLFDRSCRAFVLISIGGIVSVIPHPLFE